MRAIKNKLLKYFNKKSIVVHKYYNDLGKLEWVEMFLPNGEVINNFTGDSVNDWERYFNMYKYIEGCRNGVWVEIKESHGCWDMRLSIKEFHTK